MIGAVRVLSILLVLLLACTVASAQSGVKREPTYRLRGSGLVITPSEETIALAFNAGVTISGKDFKLSAPTVRINIKPAELISTGQLKLPDVPADQKPSVLDDPGRAAREMARELELPE